MAIQKRFGGGHGPHAPPLGTPLLQHNIYSIEMYSYMAYIPIV